VAPGLRAPSLGVALATVGVPVGLAVNRLVGSPVALISLIRVGSVEGSWPGGGYWTGDGEPSVGVRHSIWASRRRHHPALKEQRMAERENRGGIAGISTGGIIVIVGIVLMIVWSFWIGLIIVVVGLIAFGGFARGKWY
jgi:hypothetical protein